MSTISSSSSLKGKCGLSRQELDKHEWVDNESGNCKAKYTDKGDGVKKVCGDPYADHHSDVIQLSYGGAIYTNTSI
jgi:hypothetical protein